MNVEDLVLLVLWTWFAYRCGLNDGRGATS